MPNDVPSGSEPGLDLSPEELEVLELAAEAPHVVDLSPETSALFRQTFGKVLLHDLPGEVDIESTTFQCGSAAGKISQMMTILSFTLEWGVEHFGFPDQFVRLMPHVVNRSYRPNAFAHSIARQAIVGYNIGLAYAIEDACSSVAHHKQFATDILGFDDRHRSCQCPVCGGPRRLDNLYTDYSWLTGSSPNSYGSWVPIVASTVPTPRSTIGGQLMDMCLQWTAGHELAHVLLGHLGWREDARAALFESRSEGHRASSHDPTREIPEISLMHTAEVEADRLATRFTLSNPGQLATLLAQKIETAESGSAYDGEWPRDLDVLVELMIRVVPVIMHCIFARNSALRLREWSRAHPSADARRLYMMGTLQPPVGAPARDEEYWWQAGVGAVYSVFGYWDEADLSGTSLDELNAIHAQTVRAVAEFGTMESRLEVANRQANPPSGRS